MVAIPCPLVITAATHSYGTKGEPIANFPTLCFQTSFLSFPLIQNGNLQYEFTKYAA